MQRIREHFTIDQSDCTVVTDNLDAITTAKHILEKDLHILKSHVKKYPEWEKSLAPINSDTSESLIQQMELISSEFDVGPMASVAGVLADRMQFAMIQNNKSRIAVIENGGEIAISSSEDIIVGLYVLTSALKANIGFRFKGGSIPIGIGTSSGTFGHAFSMGKADAVTIFARTAGIADTAATRICNEIIGLDYEAAILGGLECADKYPGIDGIFISYGGFVGQKGKVPSLINLKDAEDSVLHEKFKFV